MAVFILFFSWALEFIPLTSLAAVLLVVAGRMVEMDRMRAIWRAPIGDRIILVGTLGTTLFWDLRYVLPVGLALAAVIFIQRVSGIFEVRAAMRRSSTRRSWLCRGRSPSRCRRA